MMDPVRFDIGFKQLPPAIRPLKAFLQIKPAAQPGLDITAAEQGEFIAVCLDMRRPYAHPGDVQLGLQIGIHLRAAIQLPVITGFKAPVHPWER